MQPRKRTTRNSNKPEDRECEEQTTDVGKEMSQAGSERRITQISEWYLVFIGILFLVIFTIMIHLGITIFTRDSFVISILCHQASFLTERIVTNFLLLFEDFTMIKEPLVERLNGVWDFCL
ncbi:MAG: hypothetical protein AB7P49_00120 [Bdellovibrionales bacterium]